MLAASAARADGQHDDGTLYLTTEYSPPGSMQVGGNVIGSATEKVREAMARAAISYTIELLPWKRAYSAALLRSDGCVFSATRTPERERLFKWAGPIDEGEWVLLGRADRKFNLATLEDARKLRIGTYNGDARDEYLRARGFTTDPVQNDMINPRKLLMNRIDLWAAGISRGSAMLAVNGWNDKIVPVLSFNRVKVYIACNRAVPDAAMYRLNAAFEAMDRDGTIRRLDRKYENWVQPGTVAPQ